MIFFRIFLIHAFSLSESSKSLRIIGHYRKRYFLFINHIQDFSIVNKLQWNDLDDTLIVVLPRFTTLLCDRGFDGGYVARIFSLIISAE